MQVLHLLIFQASLFVKRPIINFVLAYDDDGCDDNYSIGIDLMVNFVEIEDFIVGLIIILLLQTLESRMVILILT